MMHHMRLERDGLFDLAICRHDGETLAEYIQRLRGAGMLHMILFIGEDELKANYRARMVEIELLPTAATRMESESPEAFNARMVR